jgi:hypothetical protein
MKSWQQAMKDSVVTGSVAAAAASAVVAWRGRHDSNSAIAPINATSHVVWGDEAAEVDHFTWQHTLPGIFINAGAGIWWGLVFQKLFGTRADQHGFAAATMGGAATAALAYAVDYHLVPKRLTPGWEMRISPPSLFMGLCAMGAGLAIGAALSRKVRDATSRAA